MKWSWKWVRYLGGIVVLLLGVEFFLSNFGISFLGLKIINYLWPLILVIVGVGLIRR